MTSKSVSVTTFQYLICPSLSSMTTWMQCSMLDTRDLQYFWLISVTQTALIACLRFSALDGCLYAILSFVIVHMFSIGLGSRLFLGNSSTEILFCLQELSGYLWSVTMCAIMHEDHSAMDMHVQFQLLFEQFHILGSIHGDVRWNEIQKEMFQHILFMVIWCQTYGKGPFR